MGDFFVEYNCNPRNLDISDCVIRAIATAFDKDWRIQYQELVTYALLQDEGRLCTYVSCFGEYLLDKGCVVHHSFKVGRRKARIKDLKELSVNRTFLVLSTINKYQGHLTCVRNGHVYDTWDCSDCIIDMYWEVANEN